MNTTTQEYNDHLIFRKQYSKGFSTGKRKGYEQGYRAALCELIGKYTELKDVIQATNTRDWNKLTPEEKSPILDRILKDFVERNNGLAPF